MAKMDGVKVTVDADFMRELKRIRAALEALAPETRSKVDAAADQAAEEFHTGSIPVLWPYRSFGQEKLEAALSGDKEAREWLWNAMSYT